MRTSAKLLVAALLFTSINSFANSHTANKGKTSSNEIVERHVSGFSGISVGGPFDVVVAQGEVESVKVEAPAHDLNKVATDVNNDVLKIYSKDSDRNWAKWWNTHEKVIVYVTIKDLKSINISSTGDVFFMEGITANSLDLNISGSGNIIGNLYVNNLESNISGHGDIKIAGTAENSIVKVASSGNFTAPDLVTLNSSVHVSGSGDAEINASDSVSTELNGSGTVHYTGFAKGVTYSKNGATAVSEQ